jgi:hypothetical protein
MEPWMSIERRGIGLPNHIVIVVPSTTRVTEPLSDDVITQYVERTKLFLAERFGGATTFRGEGSWVSSSRRLVNEPVTYVIAFTMNLSEEQEDEVFFFAEQMRDELEQEQVAIIINGIFYLV